MDREPYVEMIRKACGCSKKTADRIADAFPRGYGIATATPAAFRHLGATEVQAQRLATGFELGRYAAERTSNRHGRLLQPSNVSHYVRRAIGGREQESFAVIFLDSRQRVIDAREIGRGSLSQVDIHPRELFRDAIRLRAHRLILAHNHPSGDPEPSEADVELTHRMVEVGKLVGIPVLDHLVVTRDDYASLAALGLVPD